MKIKILIAISLITMAVFASNKKNDTKLDTNSVDFFKAAKANDIKSLKSLLDKGIDRKIKDEKGMAVLLYTVKNGYKEATNFLIENNFSKDELFNHIFNYHYRETFLMYAARTGNLKAIELLLSIGADINAKDARDFTALMHAATRGQINAVKLLIKHGANISLDINDKELPFLRSTYKIKSYDLEEDYPGIYKLLDNWHEVVSFDKYINLKIKLDAYRRFSLYDSANIIKDLIEIILSYLNYDIEDYLMNFNPQKLDDLHQLDIKSSSSTSECIK